MERDPYSRVEYRALIAWPERIKREWPLIEELLQRAPNRRLLDLGSGTGEHSRFIAEQGYEVLGVDASESMVERATDTPLPPNLRFKLHDFRHLESLDEGAFGTAICLGNALPHLTMPSDMEAFARGARSKLAAGGSMLMQILNYDRIITKKERSLPLNFRPDPEGGGDLVFVRLMEPRDDGTVIFFPTTLQMTDDPEDPVRLMSSKRVELRGWRFEELREIFASAGFRGAMAYGGFDKQAYNNDSRDLLLIVS